MLAVSHEPLPMTLNYTSKACVLQLDLANYTSLTASCDALVLASNVQVCACSPMSLYSRVHPPPLSSTPLDVSHPRVARAP